MLESLTRLQADLERVGKPREVEGVLDRYLIRPSGYAVARWFSPRWVSPNLLSVMAVIFGWASAFFFFQTAKLGNIPYYSSLATLFMFAHSVFDSADGQLARLRGSTSEFGRVLDGICDYLTFAAIYLGIGVGLGLRPEFDMTFSLTMAAVGAASHAAQSATVEYQRNLYRHYVYGTELPFGDDDGSRTTADNREGSGFSLLHTLHGVYTRIQHMTGGSSLMLSREITAWSSGRLDQVDRVMDLVIAENRGRLPYWALLAPNSHKLGMIVAAFLPVCATSVFGQLGLYWYLLYVIVGLNLLMALLLLRQSKADSRIRGELLN